MIDFDLHQLEYFVCAARTGNYSQAARELFVTPQAISRSIQLLEARVGVKLFRRASHGIVLTDFGTVFLSGAQAALDSLEALQETAARFRQDTCATLVLGIHALCFRENGGSLDRNELLAFHRTCGTLAFSFIEMPGDTIVESLCKKTIDVGITVPPAADPDDFEHRRLKSFPLAVVVAKTAVPEFSPDGQTATIERLTRGELVLFANQTSYNDVLLNRSREEGVVLPVSSSLQISAHGNMGFLADGRLYVVRPLQHAQRTVHDERLQVLPLTDSAGNPVLMNLDIILRHDHVLTSMEEDLLEFVAGCYK